MWTYIAYYIQYKEKRRDRKEEKEREVISSFQLYLV